MIGVDKILGVSVKTKEQALEAERAGADYVGAGAVFASQSKSSSVIGLERLKEIANAISIPVVAIGGITEHNARDALQHGAKGVALISGIFDSPDVEASALRIRKLTKQLIDQ